MHGVTISGQAGMPSGIYNNLRCMQCFQDLSKRKLNQHLSLETLSFRKHLARPPQEVLSPFVQGLSLPELQAVGIDGRHE